MFTKLTKRTNDSIAFSIGLIGLISTVATILGYSLKDCMESTSVKGRFFVVLIVAGILYVGCYVFIGFRYKKFVKLVICNTVVEVGSGDIFQTDGYRVIGCDTHFNTRADDIVIAKKSLHGQLLLNHGNIEEIVLAVEKEAQRLGLKKDENGQYDFPLGSIIRYESNVDHQIYLLLAMTELNHQFEAHTNMAKYEQMLMKMWAEIGRVYASNNIVLPLLGFGITRFDDGPKERTGLLRCMLCTFNSSASRLNCKVKIVIFGDTKEIPLYEYKDLFRSNPKAKW